MHKPRSVRDADVAGKRALVRADLNVPLEAGRIADETRIEASLPTLRLLLERDVAGVRVCSHLGRPKGPDPAFSIEPVRARLRELLPDERIDVLENTRFDPGETKNDPALARRLADGNDLFRAAAGSGPLEGLLVFSDEPLVSQDIVGSPFSCTFDSELTMVNGRMVKVFGWYDNEWGYSCRLVDLVAKIAQTMPAAVAA